MGAIVKLRNLVQICSDKPTIRLRTALMAKVFHWDQLLVWEYKGQLGIIPDTVLQNACYQSPFGGWLPELHYSQTVPISGTLLRVLRCDDTEHSEQDTPPGDSRPEG